MKAVADGMSPEAELVARARGGDREAFAALYRRDWPGVLAQVASWVRDGDEARSLAQEVFVQAWRGLRGLRQPAAWPAFLRTIASRAAFRAANRRPAAALPPENLERADPRAPDPGREAEKAEFERALLAALADFPGPHREAVLLRLAEGLRYREVGSRLGLTEDQARGIICRGLVRLTARLKPFLLEGGPG